MAAYAEGLNIIANADVGKRQQEMDAETAPLERPELYQYEIDTAEVAEVWRRGSVVGSWLLDLTAQALMESPTARGVRGARLRLGRGPLDVDRGDRGGRARRRSSRPRCTRGSRRADWTTSRTGCSPRCASSSAATTRRRLMTPRGRGPPRRRARRPSAAPSSIAGAAAPGDRRARTGSRSRSRAGARRGAMFAALYGRMPWEKVTIFQVDERIAPDGDPDRNLTHAAAEPAAGRRRRRPADAGHGARSRGGRRRATRPRFPSGSTSSTSGSARTGTRRRSSPAIPCSRSTIATSHSPASTRADAA